MTFYIKTHAKKLTLLRKHVRCGLFSCYFLFKKTKFKLTYEKRNKLHALPGLQFRLGVIKWIC